MDDRKDSAGKFCLDTIQPGAAHFEHFLASDNGCVFMLVVREAFQRVRSSMLRAIKAGEIRYVGRSGAPKRRQAQYLRDSFLQKNRKGLFAPLKIVPVLPIVNV